MVYSFANQKGGVAKTTTVYTVASILAMQGHSVLMIDMDPQASLTISAGMKDRLVGSVKLNGMVDVLCRGLSMEEIIIKIKNNLFIAPANISLAKAEIALVSETAREKTLYNAICDMREQNTYEYIFIDCQPSIGLLVVNALTASDYVIIPVATDYLAYEGLQLISESIGTVQRRLNRDLKLLGVVATFCNNTLHSREVLTLLEKEFSVLGKIGTSTKVKDALLKNLSIYEEMPQHRVAKQYYDLAEVLRSGR